MRCLSNEVAVGSQAVSQIVNTDKQHIKWPLVYGSFTAYNDYHQSKSYRNEPEYS
jgi:hypothetical protein